MGNGQVLLELAGRFREKGEGLVLDAHRGSVRSQGTVVGLGGVRHAD